MPELPEDNPIAIVRDWACEILSPSTAKDDVRTKLPYSILGGVPYVWIIDPDDRLVEVFAPENGKPALIATASDEEAVRLPPFDDLDIDPRKLWVPSPG